MQTKLAKLDYKNKKTLQQCINRDKAKTYLYHSPFLFKNIPTEMDTELLSECWKYFKTNSTNLVNEKLKPDTKKRIEQGPNDPVVKYYLTHLKPLFEMFIQSVQLLEKEILDKTSVVLRFTFNKVNSNEFVICIIPGGKWWVLNLPTDKQKMSNWLSDLMNGNHFGRTMMISMYKVVHPERFSASYKEK